MGGIVSAALPIVGTVVGNLVAPGIGGQIGGMLGSVVGGSMASGQQQQAVNQATQMQTQATQQALNAQQAQFDAMMKNLTPFIQGGTQAIGQQGNLIGLGGQPAQQAAINAISSGPQMQALVQQGENAILQNASATGGLRGGNVQGALAQFRPQILNSLIENQFKNLGSLSTMGGNAAAMAGNTGMQTASNMGNLFGQLGGQQANALMTNQAIQNQSNTGIASALSNVPWGNIFGGSSGGATTYNPSGLGAASIFGPTSSMPPITGSLLGF